MNEENKEKKKQISVLCLATVRGNCLAFSKVKGTPSVDVQFVIDKIGDELPPGGILKIGSVHTWNGWLTDNAFERTNRTLERCFGWRGNDYEEINQNPGLFAGKQVQLVINFEPGMNDSSKLFPKVAFVNPVPQLQSLPAEDAAKIADEFREKLQAFRANQKESSRTIADLGNNGDEDHEHYAGGTKVAPPDDLPF